MSFERATAETQRCSCWISLRNCYTRLNAPAETRVVYLRPDEQFSESTQLAFAAYYEHLIYCEILTDNILNLKRMYQFSRARQTNVHLRDK